MKLRELREKRAELSKDMHDFLKKSESEDRGFTQEETQQWDQWNAKIDELDGRIKHATIIETKSLTDDAQQARIDREEFDSRQLERKAADDDPNRPLTVMERRHALRAWFLAKKVQDPKGFELCRRLGVDVQDQNLTLMMDRGVDRSGVPFDAPRSIKECREQYEQRAQGIATGAAGQFTVPDEMMRPLEESMLAWGGMRQVATVLSTDTGAPLPIPTVNDTANKGVILAENTQVAEQDVAFAQIVLGAFKYSSKLVRVSVELLQDSSVNLPAYLGSALGTRIGRITNDHFTTGAGTTEPFGIVTRAGNSGVTLPAGNIPTWANILAIEHSVDPAYRTNARWMMNDVTLSKVKSLVDTTGRPMWQASIINGEPGTLDGYPITINQSMSSALSGKSILFGDLSKYMIREARGITLLRLDERYADFHQVGFLAFARYDGDLLDAGTDPVKYATNNAA